MRLQQFEAERKCQRQLRPILTLARHPSLLIQPINPHFLQPEAVMGMEFLCESQYSTGTGSLRRSSLAKTSRVYRWMKSYGSSATCSALFTPQETHRYRFITRGEVGKQIWKQHRVRPKE